MKWQEPYKEQRVEIDDLNVYPMQCLTVWLNRNPRHMERDAAQMEIRITESGTFEIFADPKRVKVRPWTEWKAESLDQEAPR